MDRFDGVAFAKAMRDRRRQLDLSTRDLARLAGISQAYVVALEGPIRPGGRPGPTPTVDVVARLAGALRRAPGDLLAAALRPNGRHVLVVSDEPWPARAAAIGSLAGPGVERWILATSEAVPPPQAMPQAMSRSAPPRRVDVERSPTAGSTTLDDRHTIDDRHMISVHRDHHAYQPNRVALALTDELHRLNRLPGGELLGRRLGLIFTEMPGRIATLADSAPVVAFEHVWPGVVTTAAATVGAHVEWNLCVYSVASLRALADPVGSVVDLFASHDTVWATSGRNPLTGTGAARRILEWVRPQSISASAWKSQVAALVATSAT